MGATSSAVSWKSASKGELHAGRDDVGKLFGRDFRKMERADGAERRHADDPLLETPRMLSSVKAKDGLAVDDRRRFRSPQCRQIGSQTADGLLLVRCQQLGLAL